MARPTTPYITKTSPDFYTDFNHFEPFNVEQNPPWLIELAKGYDVELLPEGSLFQTGLLLDRTETPGYCLVIAGSQTGKSRALLIEAIIMATGRVPISLAFDAGVDTGIPRKITPENIRRFGLREDKTCGNVTGCGKYPLEKIPPPNSGAQIWIASYAEVAHKMWETRLRELIPTTYLENKRNNNGWSYVRKTFSFITGAQIRLTSFETGYRKMEGEMSWLTVLDEEALDRQFFISSTEHSKYLRLCFTPINGITGWSYNDCYLPAIQKKNCPIYTCTQYGSPFQTKEKVDAKLLTYKNYEIKSRIFGQFSDVAGKPYYNYELTQQFLKAYIPRHTLGRIIPMSKIETARDALDVKMRLEPAESSGDDVFEIYEKYNERDAYWLSADVAEGNDNPDLAADTSVAYVRRLPRIAEGEKDPVMVAALQSRMRNVEFAWMCLYAAVYYNCALIAPETGVSADGAVFITTIIDYPYLYRHTSTNNKTMQAQTKLGFDSRGGANRKYAIDLIGTWLINHLTTSGIYHYPLLKEISELVVGKGGKPDHPERGSSDCVMAFGISEYVYDLAKNQIKCNRRIPVEDEDTSSGILFPNIFGRGHSMRETRPVLGATRGMDARWGRGRTAALQLQGE